MEGPRMEAVLVGKGYSSISSCEWQEEVSETLWFTYRCGFAEMVPYGLTDDAGWGCMLRSSQMLMAKALCRHLSGRRNDVIRWFADAPGEEAVFSVHNMVRVGQRYDMLPGEWYGPGIAAHVLRDLAELLDEKLRIVVTSAERPLCEEDVLDDLTRNVRCEPEIDEEVPARDDSSVDYDPLLRPPPEQIKAKKRKIAVEAARKKRLAAPWTESVLILVPIRLGLNRLEAKFVEPLLRCLRFPQSIGFVGGRPRQALYFVGAANADLVGLDPHVVQPSPGLGPGLLSEKHLDSLVCRSPRFVPAHAIDPSLALGFYCRTREDFLRFLQLAADLKSYSDPPLFDVLKTYGDPPPNVVLDDDDDEDALNDDDRRRRRRLTEDDEDDDYVVV
ncbi:hypothetical protein CTAYLR_008309 [Chrysophaeum taylorii]|uniref:Cysteine protease n=1 Tax=Chrysophaeum taylorii TaxID=2483200 RepID=A0AAD7UA57_9STRA|nr:hypothetical protein CTAYLR_008309 [Chrysophaeum taylorii]